MMNVGKKKDRSHYKNALRGEYEKDDQIYYRFHGTGTMIESEVVPTIQLS
jgi:hypothetical protein